MQMLVLGHSKGGHSMATVTISVWVWCQLGHKFSHSLVLLIHRSTRNDSRGGLSCYNVVNTAHYSATTGTSPHSNCCMKWTYADVKLA